MHHNKKMVVGLESIGFKVIAVIADNNAINRKAMCKFVPPPKLSIVYPLTLRIKFDIIFFSTQFIF